MALMKGTELIRLTIEFQSLAISPSVCWLNCFLVVSTRSWIKGNIRTTRVEKIIIFLTQGSCQVKKFSVFGSLSFFVENQVYKEIKSKIKIKV